MTAIEYRASPPLPCDIPKMKRAKLEELAIDQMRQIIDLQGELMAVKNVAHRMANRAAPKVKLPDGNPYPVHGQAAYYSREQVVEMLAKAGVGVEA